MHRDTAAETRKTPKRLRFETALPGPPLAGLRTEVIRTIPDLYLQRNICAVVERLSRQRPLKCGGLYWPAWSSTVVPEFAVHGELESQHTHIFVAVDITVKRQLNQISRPS
jgi:hypothetical protein